ncbi:MAG: hypothetical protein LAP38_15265 [Acidobacteriia bacterium]|nr:hypothetical protein [Terriglobia bacterium]
MEKITQEELLMILQVQFAQSRQILELLGALVTALGRLMPPQMATGLMEQLAKATAKFQEDRTVEEILRRFEGPLQ